MRSPDISFHAKGAHLLQHTWKDNVLTPLHSSSAQLTADLGGAREILIFLMWLMLFSSLQFFKSLAFCLLYCNTLNSFLQATFSHLALPTVCLTFFISFSSVCLDAKRMSPFLIQHPWTSSVSFCKSVRKINNIKMNLPVFCSVLSGLSCVLSAVLDPYLLCITIF